MMQLLRLLEDLTDESGPTKGLPSSAPAGDKAAHR
jgi:hypothetical protein